MLTEIMVHAKNSATQETIPELATIRVDNMTNGSSTERDEGLAVIEVTVSATILFLAIAGNGCVVGSLVYRRKRLSRMHLMILHLSLADLFVAFFNVLPQLAWDITDMFRGGQFLCVSVKYFQVVAMYASSYVLLATAVDRYYAICHPFLSQTWTARHAHTLVAIAWTASLVFSLPQVLIFSYRIREDVSEYDCWAKFDPEWTLRAYITWNTASIFIVPTCVLGLLYGRITWVVWKAGKMEQKLIANKSNGWKSLKQKRPHTKFFGFTMTRRGGHQVRRYQKVKVATNSPCSCRSSRISRPEESEEISKEETTQTVWLAPSGRHRVDNSVCNNTDSDDQPCTIQKSKQRIESQKAPSSGNKVLTGETDRCESSRRDDEGFRTDEAANGDVTSRGTYVTGNAAGGVNAEKLADGDVDLEVRHSKREKDCRRVNVSATGISTNEGNRPKIMSKVIIPQGDKSRSSGQSGGKKTSGKDYLYVCSSIQYEPDSGGSASYDKGILTDSSSLSDEVCTSFYNSSDAPLPRCRCGGVRESSRVNKQEAAASSCKTCLFSCMQTKRSSGRNGACAMHGRSPREESEARRNSKTHRRRLSPSKCSDTGALETPRSRRGSPNPTTNKSVDYGRRISNDVGGNKRAESSRGSSVVAAATARASIGQGQRVGISRAKVKTIKLTLTVVICYILCWAPFFVGQMWAAYDETAPYEGVGFTIILLLASVNSCTNPWIYSIFSDTICGRAKTIICKAPCRWVTHLCSAHSRLGSVRKSSYEAST